MDTKKLKEQVQTIRQAFAYITQFNHKTFVINIDSNLINHEGFPSLIKDIVLLKQMGIRIVLVPGARTRIDEVLATYNISCEVVNGVRITTPESIPFVKMAAFDVSNKLMTMLAENRTNAIVGNWVKARSIGVRGGVDFQNSGIVEKLDISILQKVLDDGLVPIFPNIGWNAAGKPYNISSNELACTLSRELGASKLFFLSDFSGISATEFTLPDNMEASSDGIISSFTLDQAKEFLACNKAKSENRKMELMTLACEACAAGVERVHIIDGRTDGMLLKEIYSNRGFGTMVYSNQFDNIRPMETADIPAVLSIMQPLVDDGVLVARKFEDLQAKVNDYAVYVVDGIIHACGALHVFPDHKGEIAGIAVDESYENMGIGKKMIRYLLQKAHHKKMTDVFVLTTQTGDWFGHLGFVETTAAKLPAAKRKTYNAKRNSRVLIYSFSRRGAKAFL